ncbi:MAG TPA: PLP-dependent aminotransferase family protein [Thermoanaerobaculia bacterium]|nr:PLP-dependent aminotransferase family protein [Thermoanaerobaculia bacterium]
MARWELAVALERGSGTPLYLQIARAIAEDVRRGRLRAGDRLPGTRTLAQSLHVQRLTVVAAFDELAAEGWIVTQPARGAIISPELPEPSPVRRTQTGIPRRVAFELPPAPPGDMPYDVPRGGLLFAPNRPDIRLAPAELIARAYRRALRSSGDILLDYGRPQGHERLRAAVADMLASTRGIAATPDDVCITRGSQMAIALLARALIRRGDVVGVEELTYTHAVEAFRLHGARIAPLAIDGEGVRIESIEQTLASGPLRAVYLTPHHQCPTTVTLSTARRMRLLELARKHQFAIVEEDYDHEFHYDAAPVLPLASADRAGVVVYAGTFSKVLAPGLRIGYLVAPPPLLRNIAAHRLYIDVQGDRTMEFALADLIERGEVQRHIRRARREYARRRDVLVRALRRALPHELTFDVPAGGIGLWVRAADGIDIDAWSRKARELGAVFVTARAFSVTGRPRPFARLGFAALNQTELVEGVRRLAKARRALA